MTPATHGAACLDFPNQRRSSHVQVPDAQANTGFGERLTALRKVAGFEGQGKQRARSKQGPASKLEQQVESIAKLPKARQRFVSEMLETVLAQH
jgi:hypothetical protein